MNWVKENKFLTGFIVVMLIGLGALGYEVYTANSAYDEATDKYTHDAGEYNRLRHLVPFPNKQNLEAYDVQKEHAAEAITAFEADLSKKEFPLEPISPNNFQDQLKASVTAIRAKAQENGTKLPEKFYLGFDKYETTPSSNEAAAPLSRELKAIEWVMQQYLAHPATQVRDITALARVELPEERERTGRGAGSGGQSGSGGGPGGRPTGGGPGGRGPGGAPAGGPGREGGSGRRGGLVQYHPFDVTVVCKQQALMEVLNTVTGPKAPQFIVLAQIRIRNSTEKGPPRVGPDAAKPDEKQTVNYIVGEEWIEVVARWEVVDFANPAEKSAADQPAPAPGAGPGSRPAPAPAAAAAPKATPAPAAAPAPEGTLTPAAITTPATTLTPAATPAPASTPVPASTPASAPAPK